MATSRAVSATVRVRKPTTLIPYQCSPGGPRGIRSRVAFSPTRPQLAAGSRIEPAPSDAVAAAQSPAATAAPLPPLEPAALRSVSQGLRVIPNDGPSVSPMIASSGRFVLPRITAPAARSRRTSSPSRAAGVLLAAVPQVVTSPARSSESLTAIGTPRSGRCASPAARRASACSASASARSRRTVRKAFSCGSIRSMRSRYSSVSSREETSPERISSAWRTTPANASSCPFMGRRIYASPGRWWAGTALGRIASPPWATSTAGRRW